MQTPLNVGRNYIRPMPPNWRNLQSCVDHQYLFTTSRRLCESERVELFNRLNATLREFTNAHDGLFAAKT